VGIIMVKILAPGYYARQDIRTPVRMALWTLAATQLMNLAFVVPLKHAGLALAIGLGGCINAALLFRGLRRTGVYRPEAGWAKFTCKLLAALICMGAVLWWSAGEFVWWTTAATLERVVRLGVIVLFGAVVYFLALWLLGFRVADFSRRT
jgi:putative peptidoglycan lipid II flippase